MLHALAMISLIVAVTLIGNFTLSAIEMGAEDEGRATYAAKMLGLNAKYNFTAEDFVWLSGPSPGV
jgi:hypothetical protein